MYLIFLNQRDACGKRYAPPLTAHRAIEVIINSSFKNNAGLMSVNPIIATGFTHF